jgi:hypothetical protein
VQVTMALSLNQHSLFSTFRNLFGTQKYTLFRNLSIPLAIFACFI